MHKSILVAPLNWGLGHATRCIPIIKELEKNGFTPIIASDGNALALLKKEFSHLLALELPSYNIKYAKKAGNFKWKLIKNSPNTLLAITKEKKLIKEWVDKYNLCGIISDNRLGVRSKKVPSVFITHQLRVLSGNTTWITTFLHKLYIKKYTECWVPDIKEFPNLSGKLGHLDKSSINLKYIGVLSRFTKQDLPIVYNLMVVLSGPEPQRTMLEEKLLVELSESKNKIIFIKGKVEPEQKVRVQGNITIYNFMQTEELEKTFNESEIVLCRSGYTTIMDLAKLEKKAFFIPTPGQYEQEYLAKRFKYEGFICSTKQDKFKLDHLLAVQLYRGLPTINYQPNWKELFKIFN
jgi:uncharacterized protein (TIGR00661 family)